MASDAARIIGIDAVQPATPGSPDDWRTTLGQIVVRVRCDDGSMGLGVGAGGAAGMHIIRTVLQDALVGQSAADPAALHQAVCRATAFFGRKGVVVMAISGVDLALWDRRGHVEGKTVAELLNPAVDLSRQLPTYATVWDAEAARQLIAGGAEAVKLHVERFGSPPEINELRAMVEMTRELLGPEKRIMIDAFGNWDTEITLQVARELEPLQLDWIEEPLQPDDVAGYQQLCKESPIPIAGGEHEYLAEGFGWLAEQRMHAVLQPDINWCGGLTSLIEIYRIADKHGLRVCPHRGSEPYALQAIAALDPQPLAESARDWFSCLAGSPEIIAGHVTVPDRPGFGVSVDEDFWTEA